MGMSTFQRLLVVLLGSLITLTLAGPISAKRQATDYIYDGSFEDVRDKIASSFQMNVRAGGWLVRERAEFYKANPGDTTPYGTKFIVFFASGKSDTRGSFSQDLANLPLAPLTLSYYYELKFNKNPNCVFTVTLGGQQVDQWAVPTTTTSGAWTQRTVTFTPAQASGEINFSLLCPRTTPFGYWELDVDNVSLVQATSD